MLYMNMETNKKEKDSNTLQSIIFTKNGLIILLG